MSFKKLLSGFGGFAVAVAFVCGVTVLSGADSPAIKAYAAEPTINSTKITLFNMDEDFGEFLQMPSDIAHSYKLKVKNAKNVKYEIISGDSVTVSEDGTVTPAEEVWYWVGGFGYSYPTGDPNEVKDVSPVFGETVILVHADNQTFVVKANVEDYATWYADNEMREYLKQSITDSMTTEEKINVITKFAADFEYDYHYSGATTMVITGGGDCWASTSVIITMAEMLGYQGWSNGTASLFSGGHLNAIVYADGEYYECEAGFNMPAPRYYSVIKRTCLYDYDLDDKGNATLTQYDGKRVKGKLTVPSKVDGHPVKGLGEQLYWGFDGVTEIVIPDSVTTIGRYSLGGMSSLKKIKLPASLKEFGTGALTDNSQLEQITISSSNKYFTVENNVLYNKNKTKLLAAPSVTRLAVPATVTEIADYSMRNNHKLTSITIPESVTRIGEGALGDCYLLEAVDIRGNGLKSLGLGAFAYTSSLKSLKIPASVTDIDEYFGYSIGDTTIVSEAGSAIEAYCKQNEINFADVKHTHKYVTTKVDATVSSEGYTLKECEICHDCKKSAFTDKKVFKAPENFNVWEKYENVILLDWNKSEDSDGVIIQQYKDGKWVTIADVSDYWHSYHYLWDLKPATRYVFRIQNYAHGNDGIVKSKFSEKLVVYTRMKPVSDFKIKSATDSTVSLAWSKNSDASGYFIDQYKGNKWVRIADIKSNGTTSYKVTGLLPSSRSAFRITGYKKVGTAIVKSVGSNKAVIYTKPRVVPDFRLGSKSDSAVTLKWTKNFSATGYILEQYKGNKWVRIAKITNNSTTEYKVTGLTPSTRNAFRIQAYKEYGKGALKSKYTDKLVVYTNPKAVSGFKASYISTNFVTLSWAKNTSATGYIIQQYKGNKWVRIAKIENNSTTTYRVTGLKPSTRYAFRIQAYKNIGSGAVKSAYTNKLVVYTAK